MNHSKRKLNYKSSMKILLLLILLSVPLASAVGTVSIGFNDIFEIYKIKLFNNPGNSTDIIVQNIIWELRLPRIYTAIAVGGTLSVTGCVMQAMTSNVMAEPYILGIQSGAGMAAAFSIAFLSGMNIFGEFQISVFAFSGAVLALGIVYFFSSRNSNFTRNTLILTGLSISMLFSALTQLIISFSPDNSKVRGIIFWLMGGLGSVRWKHVPIVLVTFAAGFLVFYLLSEQLNILSIGEETATILGIRIRRINKILLMTTSFMVGIMVSIVGSIGFVGLIIPHICRNRFGSNHRKLLPAAALCGALFLIWADVISRIIVAPKELPIGVLTSILGVPFFLGIILKKERSKNI